MLTKHGLVLGLVGDLAELLLLSESRVLLLVGVVLVLGERGRLGRERRILAVVEEILSSALVVSLELVQVVLGRVEDFPSQLLGLLSQTEGLLTCLLVLHGVLGVGALLDDLADLVLDLSELVELLLALLVNLTLNGAGGLLLANLGELDGLLDHLAGLVGPVKDQLGDLAG